MQMIIQFMIKMIKQRGAENTDLFFSLYFAPQREIKFL